MAEALHFIDAETCRGDGICVEVCPENVLEILDGKAATVQGREENCILCGQCVAVCPTESLRMPKLAPDGFQDLPRLPLGYASSLTSSSRAAACARSGTAPWIGS